MKIGIISKPEHCAAHIEALAKDGWGEVLELSSAPTSIPPTVDLVILRTASVAHRGSDTAFAWARETGKPLIVENGLSGIRRELLKFKEQNGKYLQNKWSEALTTLRALRPTDHPEDHRKALLAMGASPALLDMLLMRASAKPELKGPDSPQIWEKAVKLATLYATREEAVSTLGLMELKSKETLQCAYREGKWPEHWRGRSYTEMVGRPLYFCMVLLLVLDSDEPVIRQEVFDLYLDYSGKHMDLRNCDAAAWIIGKTLINRSEQPSPVVAEPLLPVVAEPPVQENKGTPPESSTGGTFLVEYVSPPDPIAEEFKRIRAEFENHVLELMENIQKQGERISGLEAQVRLLTDRTSSLDEALRDSQQRVAELAATQNQVPPEIPESGDALKATLDALDAFRRRGANISITLEKL